MRGLWLLLALLPLAAYADERELAELLGRIRQNGAVEFSYQETRAMELVTLPWQGQGRMLSSADGTLVKLQLLPRRIVMVSTAQRMYYWDPEQKQRYSEAVGVAGAATEQVALLRAIIQGRTADLQSNYDLVQEQQGKRWSVRFTPKPELRQDLPTLEFSGDEDNNKQQVLINQGDDESTEYHMLRTTEGPEVEKSIQRLLLEAKGD